jgi:hypothetical protein
MTVVLKLVDLIKEGKLEDGLNARDIDRKYFGAHKKEVVDCALDELVEKNWLRAKFTQAWTGRGCDRYEVNPDARQVMSTEPRIAETNWITRPKIEQRPADQGSPFNPGKQRPAGAA